MSSLRVARRCRRPVAGVIQDDQYMVVFRTSSPALKARAIVEGYGRHTWPSSKRQKMGE